MITSFVFRALDRKARWVTAVLLAVALLIPLANLALPADHPLHVPNYTISLVGKYLCYALLALALDLVWGYCGILSLGHGAFFALGGYAMGMYLMRQIGSAAAFTADPELPDFMVFLNWESLPWYWLRLRSCSGLPRSWWSLVPGAAGIRVRLARLSQLAGHGRVSLHHDPGPHLRAACSPSSATRWASVATTGSRTSRTSWVTT